MSITLDEFIKRNKSHEIDFVFPCKNDIRLYLDLYYLYNSPEERWNKVQTLIFEYFNFYLNEYRSGKISGSELIKKLDFPEVSYIGLGYSKDGVNGRGGGQERAILIKKNIFDNNEVQEVGISALANLSIAIPNVGPDTLSDLVANFSMHYFLEYTYEQVIKYNLSTTEVNIERVLDVDNMEWRPEMKIMLPYFDDGEPRILVPKHLVKRLPVFSKGSFYENYLRYVLKHKKEEEMKTISLIGKEPKISFKFIKEELKKKFGFLADAIVSIATEQKDLVLDYISNPFLFNYLKKSKKNSKWGNEYIEQLDAIKPGREGAHEYAKLLMTIFTALYEGQLFGGKLQERSVDELFHYDIIFANSVYSTPFFNMIKNQSLKSGAVIIEAKNYDKSSIGNKEFNQVVGYTICDGRELIFLASRKEVTNKDIDHAKRYFLTHKVIVLPISDGDIKTLINSKKESGENFDMILALRLKDILSA